MAQGDTVTLSRIGELVEAVFQLDFKRTDVAARPDADRFRELRFQMKVTKRKFSHLPRESNHANPQFFDTSNGPDDAVVRVVFQFVGTKDDGTPRFLPGDDVDLFCFFSSTNSESPEGFDNILLGTVHLPPDKS